jgi:ribosomal protein S27E
MESDIHKIKECPDCGSDNLVYKDDADQVICRDCGLIYEPLAKEKK